MRGRPYEIVAVAGGWSFRTRLGFGEAIRAALGGPTKSELSKPNAVVLMAIAYFQPITRGELSQFLGREVSRDAIAALREEDLIAAGPRSPTPGAPYAYVTTPGFLGEFGFESLRDLPDIEKLQDAGLLGRTGAANPPGRISRPSCEGCWVWRPTRASRTRTPHRRPRNRRRARPASQKWRRRGGLTQIRGGDTRTNGYSIHRSSNYPAACCIWSMNCRSRSAFNSTSREKGLSLRRRKISPCRAGAIVP